MEWGGETLPGMENLLLSGGKGAIQALSFYVTGFLRAVGNRRRRAGVGNRAILA